MIGGKFRGWYRRSAPLREFGFSRVKRGEGGQRVKAY